MIIHSIEMVFILLTISVGVTALAKKAKKPYPIALVIIGAIIGLVPVWEVLEELTHFFASDEIFRTAIISIFLPALLGEAALKLSFQDLRQNSRSIIMLAFVGTLLAYLVTGWLTHVVLGVSLQMALVFGALMAATDPVSVISVFKSLGVDKRLAIIMEGESLINDGVAVVIFKLSAFSLGAILGMGAMGVAAGIASFVKVVLGGVIIGLSLGFLISQIVRFFDDYPLENAFSVVLFYGAYMLAEYVHVSGVIAVVCAGLVLGNYGTVVGMSPTTRLSITVLWDTITLVANSLVFILVGLEISRINMLAHVGPILLAIVIVFLGRSVAVYLATLRSGVPGSWKHILNWGGLKGSLSLALALSLPPDFAGREMLIALTFGVVFFSLVVQGLTIAPLIGFLGQQPSVQGLKEYESLSYELQQSLAAGEELNRIREKGRVSPPVYKKLWQENESRLQQVEQSLRKLYDHYPELLQKQEFAARRNLLYAEHQAINKLQVEGILSEQTGDERKRRVLENVEALEKQDGHNHE